MNSRIHKSKHLIYECGYLYNRTCKSKRLIYECGYLNNRIVNQNSLIYECGFTFSRIRKSFFTLNFEPHHTQFQTLFPVFAFVSRSHSEFVSFCSIYIPFVQCKFLEFSFFLFIFTNICINVFRFSYICFFPCIGGLEALFRWLTFVFLTLFGFSHCSVLFHCLRGLLWIFWLAPLLLPCPPSLLLPPPLLALP